jgi:hypothetical protein
LIGDVEISGQVVPSDVAVHKSVLKSDGNIYKKQLGYYKVMQDLLVDSAINCDIFADNEVVISDGGSILLRYDSSLHQGALRYSTI